MTIHRIRQKILADADAEARSIAAEAERTIEAIEAETAKTVTEIEKKAQDEAANQAKEQKRRMISRAHAEMRKELLEEKQHLIDQAFQKVLHSVIEMDDSKYSALMKRLLSESVEGGDEEVIVAAQERGRNWTETISEANKELSAKGLKGALTLSQETRSMAGGFVLRKGKKEVNCDLELLVESLREELEAEVARVLLSEAQSPER